jgi:uncharacterized protein (TIGR03083 family)
VTLDYVAHIRSNSARFAEVLANLRDPVRVPSCPDWDAGDLLWHLTEVQWFWGSIVVDRLNSPDPAEESSPERPGDHDALLQLFQRASRRLADALESTPPETHVWTWADNDQTAGFIRRRQAHEALIHRVDAELTADLPSVVDRTLATDGVDELLRVMLSDLPEWATFTAEEAVIRIEPVDSDRTWDLVLGRFRGTSPNTGNTYDDPAIELLDDTGTAPTTTISGTAADLDLWLWNRGSEDRLQVDGSVELFERFKAVVAEGIE